MLRSKFLNTFYDLIEAHGKFISTQFEVKSVGKENNFVDVYMVFKENPQYQINFHINQSNDKQTDDWGDMCPGDLMMFEGFSFDNIRNVHGIVLNWLDNIWEELTSSNSHRKNLEREELINEFIEKFGPLNDEHFTEAEEIVVKSKLDLVEEQLKELIEKNSKDKAELQEKLDHLHKDFENLKQSIPIYKKKGWVRNYASKIVKWSLDAENRKLLKEGYDLVKNILPEDIKQFLP